MRPKKLTGVPFWRTPWALPVGVGVVALIAGVGIGAGSKPKAAAAVHTTTSVTATATATATITQQVTTTPTQVVSTQQVVTTVTFTPAPINQFTDGQQLVGTDIPAGVYKTSGGGTCYYAILNSSDDSDIASNDNFDGPVRLVLKAGKYFETSGGCSWARVG